MFPFASAKNGHGKAAPGESGARPAGGAALLARAAKLKDGAERVTASVVKSLQVMAGTMTTIEGMVAGYATDNARAVATGQGPDTAVGAIELPGLGCNLLVTLDTTLVHGIVELLCGGNGVEPPPVAPRALTPIDQQFAQIVFALAASAIQTEWAEFGVGAVRAAKIEGPLNADIFGARVETVGLVNMTIGLFGLHGTLRLVLPPKALDRFAGESPASDAAGPEAADPAWSGLLRREIERAPVALAAFLDAKDISLGALAALKTGQILALPVEARTQAALMSDGRVLFRGEIGQDDNRYSLRIAEVVGEPSAIALMAARRSPYFEAFKA